MIVRRISNDELYHHGVKGQQWGVQNGPPYPLNATGRALVKQQRLMKKQEKAINETMAAAKYARDNNKRNVFYGRKGSVDDRYLNKAINRRLKASHDYYDLKMRKAAGDKSVKKELRNARKELNRNGRWDDSVYGDYYVHDPGNGILNEAHEYQRKVEKAYRKVNDVINKYGDRALGDPKYENKISKAIEKANKVLMEIDNERITSYKKTYGEDNATISAERYLQPGEKPRNTLRIYAK